MNNYYYTVKYGSKLKNGGCYGTFKIFSVINNKLTLVVTHKQNIVTMSPSYTKSIQELITNNINKDGILIDNIENI